MSIREYLLKKSMASINMTVAFICLLALLAPGTAQAWIAYEDIDGSPSCAVVQDYENGSIKISYTKGGGPFYITMTDSDWLFRDGQQVTANLRIDNDVTFRMIFQSVENSNLKTKIDQTRYIFFKAFNYFAEESEMRVSFPESNEDVILVPFSDPSGGLAKFRICVVLN